MTAVRSAGNIARLKAKGLPRFDSPIEAELALQLRADRAPQWIRNYVFLPDRKLEIDFAWPRHKFGIEVQGAVHRITEHFHRDAEKMALALLNGWTILPVTGRTIRNGKAIGWAMEALRRLEVRET